MPVDPNLYCVCYNCNEAIQLSQTIFFDGRNPPHDYLQEAVNRAVSAERSKMEATQKRRDIHRFAKESEHILPLVEPALKLYNIHPLDLRHIGGEVDFMELRGIHLGWDHLDGVHLVEAKTGQATLTPRQRAMEKVLVKGVTLKVVRLPGYSDIVGH